MFQRPLKSLVRADDGNVGIMFAMLLVPSLLGAGVAVDYGRSAMARQALQASVDSAALAAAGSKLSTNGSTALAEDIFSANMKGLTTLKNLQVTASKDGAVITVAASANLPTTLASMIMPSVKISATAKAKARTAGSGPLCILGLNAHADRTVRIWGTGDLVATSCAVHSNSDSAIGMVSGGSATAKAASFCSVGGTDGNRFTPSAQSQCPKVLDPLAGKYTIAALAAKGITIDKGCDDTSGPVIKNDAPPYNAGGANSVYVFCNGLTVKSGGSVSFGPGTYVFYGELLIQAGGRVTATGGSTLFFGAAGGGRSAGFLTVQAKGSLELTAPTTGPLAGVAIVQPVVTAYTGGNTPAITHQMIGGGTINVEGIMYTPQAKLNATGNGDINTTSQYFAAIADFVDIEGNGIFKMTKPPASLGADIPEITSASGPAAVLMK